MTSSRGSISNKYSYNAFGSVTKQSGRNSNNHKFLTKESDASGLVYFGARYYDPEIGRFITQDPTGMIDGPNLYAYCRNNPVNFSDPYGYWYIDINISFGMWGIGVTGGIMFAPKGVYKYVGLGVMTPGPGGSLTFSKDDPAEGWNAALQVNYMVSYQQGRDYTTLFDFREYGIGSPGASFTMFYVDQPWKWPWLKTKTVKTCHI